MIPAVHKEESVTGSVAGRGLFRHLQTHEPPAVKNHTTSLVALSPRFKWSSTGTPSTPFTFSEQL
jgi:hypothetical protein